MINRKLILFFFILVALAQLYVPAKMIFDREDVLATGTEYKFKIAPIDPSDPFRGKYITLNYVNNTIDVEDNQFWTDRETVYVTFFTYDDGFAGINNISKEKPSNTQDFLKTKLRLTNPDILDRFVKLVIDLPFDRFYMEEFKANDAEQAYSKSLQDTSKVTYALVMIKNGAAVLKDVLIDGVSIEEIVRLEQLNKN
jgi:uncharacterized membrane-anchored protein